MSSYTKPENKKVKELHRMLQLKKDILILREQFQSWENWHCSDYRCDHHMCRVRYSKVRSIMKELHDKEVIVKLIEHKRRYESNCIGTSKFLVPS